MPNFGLNVSEQMNLIDGMIYKHLTFTLLLCNSSPKNSQKEKIN